MNNQSNAGARPPKHPERLRPKPPACPVVVSSIASAGQGAEAPGHWRRVFYVSSSRLTIALKNDARWLSGEEIICGVRFPSEKDADEDGRKEEARFPVWLRPHCRYLRAEFFPEYG